MSTILIVDTTKSSIVMTSEIFKDKILGAKIFIARSGEECLNLIGENNFDMIVVDFDLPDVDGVTLIKLLRKLYSGPVLLTSFPGKVVQGAIDKEQFAYQDICDWLSKPIKKEKLVDKIDKYIVKKKRISKRFTLPLDALLISKGAGRGKRTPKVKGNILNLGVGGALIALDETMKLEIGDEISLTLSPPSKTEKKTSSADAKKKTTKTSKSSSLKKEKVLEIKGVNKIKAKVAWSKKKQAGICFESLSDVHRKSLENILRQADEI